MSTPAITSPMNCCVSGDWRRITQPCLPSRCSSKPGASMTPSSAMNSWTMSRLVTRCERSTANDPARDIEPRGHGAGTEPDAGAPEPSGDAPGGALVCVQIRLGQSGRGEALKPRLRLEPGERQTNDTERDEHV